MIANGAWPVSSSRRRVSLVMGLSKRRSDAKRRLPSRSRSSASRAGIIRPLYLL
jgi:hypothetical protein